MECIVGQLLSVPGAPKLDQGGRAGKRKQGERRDPPAEVGSHQILRNLGILRQHRHRTIAAKISRDGQQAQNAKEEEAASLRRLIVGDERGDVKAEHEYEPDRRKDAHEKMPMRRRLRDADACMPPACYCGQISTRFWSDSFGRTQTRFCSRLLRPAPPASGGSLVSQRLLHNSGALRPCVYRASGSGRSWNFTSFGGVPLPPSTWNGVRLPADAQIPRPFQPPFGSSIRPSMVLA